MDDGGRDPEAPENADDQPLLDLLDTLVEERGRVPAAEALAVNYRTVMACYESRRVSRRMRQALAEFRDVGGAGAESDYVVGDDETEQEDDALERRVAALESEG